MTDGTCTLRTRIRYGSLPFGVSLLSFWLRYYLASSCAWISCKRYPPLCWQCFCLVWTCTLIWLGCYFRLVLVIWVKGRAEHMGVYTGEKSRPRGLARCFWRAGRLGGLVERCQVDSESSLAYRAPVIARRLNFLFSLRSSSDFVMLPSITILRILHLDTPHRTDIPLLPPRRRRNT